MSLYDLWRARIAMALVLLLGGAVAASLCALQVLAVEAGLLLALSGLVGAALVFPWGRGSKPERPVPGWGDELLKDLTPVSKPLPSPPA